MLLPPTEQEIFAFTSTTHSIDRIPLYADQIKNTWDQKGKPNPFAQGHFRAIMYVIHQLLSSTDFPAKAPDLIKTIRDSDTALFWLRTIHHKMADPLIGHELLADDVNAPTSSQVGSYRINNTMAIMKPAPPAYAVPALMHNWLKDYASFHAKIKDKVDNPYGLDKETAQEVVRKTHEINLFFCVVQPLACLNQRMGRLIENTFRLAWHLPMKIFTSDSMDYRQLTSDLQRYENDELPRLVNRLKDVRG